MTARVVLADDHQLFLDGLEALLAAQRFAVVGRTTDRDELLELIEARRPDLAVVDLAMPGLAVPLLVALLSERQLPTRVLVLTGCNDPQTAVELLAAGVKGYVLKEHAFAELMGAVAAVLHDRVFVSPEVAGAALSHARPTEVVLTSRQLEILRLIAQGFTSKRIARQLGIHLKTVDNHRQRLREKLGVHSSAELVRVATERGLV